METVATCLYYKVNPFDQPAVEEGKKLTIKYLS
jgi:glucose-6-phosphate isomerase